MFEIIFKPPCSSLFLIVIKRSAFSMKKLFDPLVAFRNSNPLTRSYSIGYVTT